MIRRLGLLASAIGAIWLGAAEPAGAAERVVRVTDGRVVVVPAQSPLAFQRYDARTGEAVFSGRVVLTGAFAYACPDPSDGPARCEFTLHLYPDKALASQLPRWREWDRPVAVSLDNPTAFAKAAIPQPQRTAVASGKRRQVTGRAVIVAADFRLGYACDAPYYTARFVGLSAPAPRLQTVRLEGDPACGD